MPTLPKARKIAEAITREINVREKTWEIDPTLTRIRFEITVGRRTGMPIKIHCETHGETDLAETDRVK